MGAKRSAFAVALACIAVLGAARAARAEEKRVVDQLLDILRANKQITDQQYRELKRQAEEERQEDLRKAPPPPPPPPPVAEAAPPTPAPETMRAYYKNGFVLESGDKNFLINIGGRLQADWNVSMLDEGVRTFFDLPATQSGAEFRRARLSIAGLVYGIIDYKIEYDFATGEAEAKDVFLGMRKVPAVQYVRVGHFKEPFSLEEITSDSFTTFMERGLPNAFSPSRNTGIAIFPNFFEERMTYGLGAFAEVDNTGFGFGPDHGYNITTRLTGLPIYEDKGWHLLHLGFAYSHKFRHDESITFSQRPESHLFPVTLVNTNFGFPGPDQVPVETNGVDLINPEIAWVWGQLSLQAEYQHAFVNQVADPDPSLGGWYAFVSYFVTEGDKRDYRLSDGAFDRIVPKRNFSLDGKGLGAWEVAARFSRLDLNSENVDGGALDDVTAGVNWYLNPVTRVTVNYVWAHLESVGDSNIVQGRFQLSF